MTLVRYRKRADDGAVLVLALVFMVAVGMITIGLLSVGNASLFTTVGLQHQRNAEYGADAAMEAAIQTVRYQAPSFPLPTTCTPTPSAVQTFPPSGKPAFTVNTQSFVVQYCVKIPAGYWGRQVTFSACESSSASTCFAGGAIIQATVVYNDVKAGCASGATYGCYGAGSWGAGFWGTTLTVMNWNVVQAA